MLFVAFVEFYRYSTMFIISFIPKHHSKNASHLGKQGGKEEIGISWQQQRHSLEYRGKLYAKLFDKSEWKANIFLCVHSPPTIEALSWYKLSTVIRYYSFFICKLAMFYTRHHFYVFIRKYIFELIFYLV